MWEQISINSGQRATLARDLKNTTGAISNSEQIPHDYTVFTVRHDKKHTYDMQDYTGKADADC